MPGRRAERQREAVGRGCEFRIAALPPLCQREAEELQVEVLPKGSAGQRELRGAGALLRKPVPVGLAREPQASPLGAQPARERVLLLEVFTSFALCLTLLSFAVLLALFDCAQNDLPCSREPLPGRKNESPQKQTISLFKAICGSRL